MTDWRKYILSILSMVCLTPAICFSAENDDVPAYVPLRSWEIEQLVRPVALYPDLLLQNIFAAATFPDQIVDASLFIKSAKDAPLIKDQAWDQSVKIIAAYPGVLRMMSDGLQWTINIGKAVVHQHEEVSRAVQNIRKKAVDSGTLKTSDEQKVSTQTLESGQNVILVEPANPEVVYVPDSSSTSSWTDSPLVPLATFGVGMALGAAISDDHDDVYYGGWGGPAYWYDDDHFDKWADNRRAVWEDVNARKWDRQEFRQDMYSQGKLSPRTGETVGGSQERPQLESFEQQNRQQAQKQFQQKKSAASSQVNQQKQSARQQAGGSVFGGESDARTASFRSGSGGAFENYGSRNSISAMSSRGSGSRALAGGSFQGRPAGGGGMRAGGARGGGGRGRR